MPTNENPALAGGVSEDGHAATLIISEDMSTKALVQASGSCFSRGGTRAGEDLVRFANTRRFATLLADPAFKAGILGGAQFVIA